MRLKKTFSHKFFQVELFPSPVFSDMFRLGAALAEGNAANVRLLVGTVAALPVKGSYCAPDHVLWLSKEVWKKKDTTLPVT